MKSGSRWSEDRITDAGYNAMIRAIREDRTPNLLVLQYSADWCVRNLLLVPSFFFTEAAIERRKPLSAGARRAGWVGCNIRLSAIAPAGKLRVVRDGRATDPATVREEYRRVRPLAALPVSLRGWALAVLRCAHDLKQREFKLADVYAAESRLAKLYPGNRNIRPKIRQQLQVLRDLGILRFHGAGRYSLV
ncbi:MAG: restriction endonuclease [Planctomycetia bacterium]|nr:restriction endonuclease [Planctomycetia bacterium]